MEPSVGTGAAALDSSVASSSSAPTLSERSWTCIDLVSSSPSSGQPQVRSLGSIQDIPKVEQGTPLQIPSLHQQRNKLPQKERPFAVPQSGHAKTISTYLDEFKNGFPVDGLSSVSVKWWGNTGSDDKDTLSEKERVKNEPSKDSTAKTGETDHEDDKNTLSEKERVNNEPSKDSTAKTGETDHDDDKNTLSKKERVNNEPSKGSIANTGETNHEDDQASTPVVGAPCVTAPCNTENPEAPLEGASLLSAIRKKNAEDGIRVHKFAISRGYGITVGAYLGVYPLGADPFVVRLLDGFSSSKHKKKEKLKFFEVVAACLKGCFTRTVWKLKTSKRSKALVQSDVCGGYKGKIWCTT